MKVSNKTIETPATQALLQPSTFCRFLDEGHGFGREENTMSFMAVAEAFLSECLGGRYEPIGDDFEGSSITVPIGAEEIPGLTEVLSA